MLSLKFWAAHVLGRPLFWLWGNLVGGVMTTLLFFVVIGMAAVVIQLLRWLGAYI